MHFDDLRTFLNVAETGSVSQAAHHLYLTQPAVSKRIQRMEDALQAQLFDRIGKRLHLTEAGRLLVPRAQHMLNALLDTERQLRNLSERVGGTLNLATSHHIGLHRLAPILRQYRAQYANVQLNIAFEDSEVAHDMVRQGEIELAVVTLNPEGDDRLDARTVWHDPLVFVDSVPRPGRLSMQALAELPCVLPGTATYTGRIVLQQFRQHGIRLEPGMSTNYLETIGMLVSVGMGWSVLPLSMTESLHRLEVDCPAMTRNLGCITDPQRVLSNAAAAFMQVLQASGDRL